jgi:hypothetical protein
MKHLGRSCVMLTNTFLTIYISLIFNSRIFQHMKNFEHCNSKQDHQDIVQVLLYTWVRCFLSYAPSRTNRHTARWWNAGLIRFQTTRKFDLKLTRITIGNPFSDSSMSCIFVPAPYIGLFLVPTNNWNNVELWL